MLGQNAIGLSRYFSFSPPDRNQAPARRNDLDWLRIILFGLLIIHHVGMFYVSNWGWHAKSQYTAEWLESVLLVVEPWRMPAIWLISGIAIRFVLAKVTIARFISLRSLRLLLPLLVGVLIVVPPQLYIEMTARGEIAMSYWQFTLHFFNSDSPKFTHYSAGIWPHIDVNHLWYLRELWIYSLTLVLLLPLLNSIWLTSIVDWLSKQHGAITLAMITAIVLTIQMNWDMSQVRYPLGLTFLLLGYTLGWHQGYWQKLANGMKPLLVLYATSSTFFICMYNFVWLDVINGQPLPDILVLPMMASYSVARVLGVSVVLSLSYRFLNKRSKHQAYLSEAVFPFYIFHQTLIVVFGFYFTTLNMAPALEATLLTASTLIGSWVLYEIVRRVEILRPCFGLKMQRQYSTTMNRLGYTLGFVLISPLALRLLF